MTLKPLGDSAWLVEFPGLAGEAALARVTGLMAALEKSRPAGVLDVVASFASLAVHFEGVDGGEIFEWITTEEVSDSLPAGKEVLIPVCYGGGNGPDLEEVAEFAGISPAEVIQLHSSVVFTVAAVGFSPGFPYLLGLPERLHMPRLQTPRRAVPAGSVAIAGGQAGIYPTASPGGWRLLGRTDARLFDPHAERPALLKSGDRVCFVEATELEPVEEFPAIETEGGPIEVIHPGALTTVQDLGRPGYQAHGVSRGGAVDRKALRLANLLVGNDESMAALEICLSGPVLKFHEDAVVAVVGATGRSWRVAAGETVDFSKLTEGVRACLAVAGGLVVPQVMGSAATDVRAGFGGLGGRALKAGDRLQAGTPNAIPHCGDWHVGRRERTSTIELRFITGVQEHWFSPEARQRFREDLYQLTPRSDRMGTRLSGPPLELAKPREMVSQPIACGSVQVPPDGQPIVLLAECQTIGGYPQIGHVISVDLPKLARAWPGTKIRFREVSLEEARELLRREELDFNRLRTGLELLR